jgi:hypothetical protein
MSKFSDNENKKMLWQILYEQSAFEKINNNYFDNIKKEFENLIHTIDKEENYDLKNKNKLLLREIVKCLDKYKDNVQYISRPLEDVKIKIDNDLKEKEKEFIELIKRPSPTEINFTENIDEPMKEDDINAILDKMIADREIEINNIIPPKLEESEKKEENDDKEDNDDREGKEKEMNQPKKLTSEFFKTLSNSNKNETNKFVSFNEDKQYNKINNINDVVNSQNTQNYLVNDNIITLLNKILENQKIIIKNQEIFMRKDE